MTSWKRLRLILKDGSSAIERSLSKSRSETRGRRNDLSYSHTALAGCSRQQQFSINRFNGFPLARGLQGRMPHVNSFVLALLASLDLGNAPSRTDVGQTCCGEGFGKSVSIFIRKRDLHEDQLLQRRSHSRTD